MAIASAHGAASFPRTARLTRKSEFDRALRAPGRCGSTLFRVQVIANEATGCARLGLAIAKRVARRAHDRNRIKRQVREVFRKRKNSMPPFDIVVFARPEAVAASTSELRADLERLLDRVCALNPSRSAATMPAPACP